jgi:hypothetical protein
MEEQLHEAAPCSKAKRARQRQPRPLPAAATLADSSQSPTALERSVPGVAREALELQQSHSWGLSGDADLQSWDGLLEEVDRAGTQTRASGADCSTQSTERVRRQSVRSPTQQTPTQQTERCKPAPEDRSTEPGTSLRVAERSPAADQARAHTTLSRDTSIRHFPFPSQFGRDRRCHQEERLASSSRLQRCSEAFGTAMRMRGLEPPRGFPHTDLNRARLPIPPHPRGQTV